jgi:deoxyribose-phosphate aldolase
MNIARMIDHTLLKADATKDQIEKLCSEAREYQFASVCVNPVWVKEAAQALKGSNVEVCTVIGFPLGATTTETKVFEAKNALENGATEVDMVINIGALKNDNLMTVEEDIRAVVQEAKGKAITKVIIETCLLTEKQKVSACQLAVKAGAEFVKTSTGFSNGGATFEDVALMRSTVGPEIGVKASGGIRSLTDMKKMIEAGASRVGASAGVQIMKELIMK